MVSTRLSALTAAALLAVGLSACDGSTAPVTTPPPSIDIAGPSDGGGGSDGGDGSDDGDGTAPVAAEIPAPDPADFPGMDEETPQGAEQAFRYYWAVLVWAHQVGETEQLEALSTDDCENCAEFESEVKYLAAEGDLWGNVVITDERIAALDDQAEFDRLVQYEFVMAESGQESMGADDGAVTEQRYRTTGGLMWSGDSWLVKELSVQALSGESS